MQNISKKLIMAIVIVIIALVAGGLFWFVSVKEKQAQLEMDLQQQKDILKLQEISLIPQIPDDGEKHPRNPRIIPIDGKDTDWYEIPELGVKAELNDEFAHNLVYAVQSYRTTSSRIQGVTAYFLSKNDILEGCDLNETSYGDSGMLSILYTKDINELQDGDFFPSADPRRNEAKGKQFPDFYLYFDKSPETCRSAMFEETQKGTYKPKNFYRGSGMTYIDSTNVVPIDAQ